MTTALERVVAAAQSQVIPPAPAPVAPMPSAPPPPDTANQLGDLQEAVATLSARVEALESAAVSDALDEMGDWSPMPMMAAAEPPPFSEP